MLSKETFSSCVNSIVELNKKIEELYRVSPAFQLFDFTEMENMKHQFESLISECTNDEDDPSIGTLLSYWLYECENGSECEVGVGNKKIKLNTVDKLYDFLEENSNEKSN